MLKHQFSLQQFRNQQLNDIFEAARATDVGNVEAIYIRFVDPLNVGQRIFYCPRREQNYIPAPIHLRPFPDLPQVKGETPVE
jgi:hypothetical protein